MKRQDKDQLKQLTQAELEKRLAEAKVAVIDTKLKIQVGQIKDVQAVGKRRQEVAILQTYLQLKKEEA